MDVLPIGKHPEFRVRSPRFTRRPVRTITVVGLALLLTTGAVRTAVASGFAAGASQNFTVVPNPRAVVLGDVNNDGIQDMVAPSSSGAGFSVLRGLGGGAFAAAQTFPGLGLGIPALADLDGDGKLDFVATEPGNDFLIIYR